MDMILDEIMRMIRHRERDRFDIFSVTEMVLAKRAKPVDVLSLIANGFFVIAECKKGSPSKGIIRADYNPRAIASAYQRGGAAAVSVITEENFFFGKPSHLPQVKEEVTLPLLRKDFLLHPYQVFQSYNLGADFILLIAACLTDRQLAELYFLSLSLGMQVLLEVHDQEDLARVLRLKPQMIGINNRDLKTFQVNVETSFTLKKLIPDDVFVISESGIRLQSDIERLKQAGFAGVLVGESLLSQADPAVALKRLLHKEE